MPKENDLKIAASILTADFANLGREIEKLCQAGVDWIHLDVMDGHFVPNISFGPALIAALRHKTKRVFDCHLMISNPDSYLEAFSHAGCDFITVHLESCHDIVSSIKKIRQLGKKVGVSLRPKTSEESLRQVLDMIDLILIMTVEPGFGGQSLIPSMALKVERIKKMLHNRSILISVDGGINTSNAGLLKKAGADILVVGSAIFQTKSYKKNIELLKKSALL